MGSVENSNAADQATWAVGPPNAYPLIAKRPFDVSAGHGRCYSTRRAYLLLLDDQRRLLLCGGCCGGWTVPQVRINDGGDYEDAAAGYLLERFNVAKPRFGAVHGVHESRPGDTWEFDRLTVSRALIIHVSNRQGDDFEGLSASHARWGIEDLRRRRREISPEGLVLLITGYVEGWIPDGPISLP